MMKALDKEAVQSILNLEALLICRTLKDLVEHLSKIDEGFC